MSTQKKWTRFGFLFFAVALPVVIYFFLAEQASWRPKFIISLQNIADFAMTKDGKFLVVAVNEPPSNRAALNSEIQIWNFNERKLIRRIKTGLPNLAGMIFSPDQKRLAILGGRGCDDSSAWCGRIKIYDTSHWKSLKMSQVIGTPETLLGFVTPDKLLLHNENECVQIWNMKDQEPELEIRTGISGFAYSPKKKLIACYREDESFEIWNAVSKKRIRHFPHIRPLPQDEFFLGPMEFSPDGKQLAIGHNQSIKVWNVKDGTLVKTFRQQPTAFYGFVPAGTTCSVEATNLWHQKFAQGLPQMSQNILKEMETFDFTPDSTSILYATPDGIYQQRIQ